jgi:NAD(P)-dependent dehydrogenase (short-subunit alcohol dehydrogenase family)
MSPAVVVTGAARGIGAAIAARFAQAGWHPLVVDLDPSVAELAAKVGGTAVVADVTDRAGRAAIAEQLDALDVPARALVNNAGITRDALIKRMDEDQFLAVLRVNLGAAYELSVALAPLLSDGGSIVNLSSKSASGNVGQYNYAVSKAGLLGLTRSMALGLAPRVRVNAIAPAFIATEMTAAIPEELRERFIARIPFGRAGEPEEIASVVEWLTSDGASYVTGQVLPVCGGRSFGPS